MTNEAIQKELEAYTKMRDELRAHHMGKYVLIKDGALIDTFDDFNGAATRAVELFGDGPYLIRQVGSGESPMPMPASVAYHHVHASS